MDGYFQEGTCPKCNVPYCIDNEESEIGPSCCLISDRKKLVNSEFNHAFKSFKYFRENYLKLYLDLHLLRKFQLPNVERTPT
jgi:hypothetical protein